MTFSLCTIAGSGVWNGLLIGLGAALGDQHQLVERYSRFLNYAIYVALAAVIGWLIVRKVRRHRAATD